MDAMKSPANRFYSFDLTAALEETVSWLLKTCREYLESEGYVLSCARTKNLYVQMKPQEATTALDQGALLVKRIARAVEEKAENDYGVKPEISLICREHFKSVIIPSKVAYTKEPVDDIRYAAYSGEEVLLNGLKVSGADWTGVTSVFQEGLYTALFKDENIDEWMKNFVTELKDGKYNADLVYSRKLVKKVDEYTGNIPPHVKAARLMEKPGKIIRYLMTARGPVPEEMNPNDIDYQHYIDKQLGPVADVYLELKGQKFENLFKAQQLSLFDF